jgi:hypothetical protein
VAHLSLFDITYVPRTAIKSQALADFMADLIPSAQIEKKENNQMWTLFKDGA